MRKIHLLLALLAGVSVSAFAQQRGWPVATNDESGFVQIFDGKSLAGWEGDTNYWRVEDGCLIGEGHHEQSAQAKFLHRLAWRRDTGFLN